MQTKITQFAPATTIFCCTILSTLFSLMYAQEVEREINFFDTQVQAVEVASVMKMPIMAVIDGLGGSSLMDKTTFKDQQIIDYLDYNFVSYRVPLNSTEGSYYYNEFKLGKYLLKDYPVYIFLESDGHTPISVNVENGYKTPEVLLDIMSKACAKKSVAAPSSVKVNLKDKAQKLWESEFRYLNDVRDEQSMRELLYQMKSWESVDKKILLEYFSLRDYSMAYEHCQQVILDFAENTQSPAFVELMRHKEYLSNVLGKSNIDKKIKNAVRASIVNASLNKDRTALANTIDVIDNAGIQDANDYKTEMLLLYYEKVGDWNSIAKTISDYCTSGRARNAELINKTTLFYTIRTDEKAKLEMADNWLKTASQLKPNSYINLETQAIVSYKANTKKNRKELLDKALAEAKRAGDSKHSVSLLTLINLMDNKTSINSQSYNPEFLEK